MTTQATNPIAYARGVLEVEAETALRDLARVTAAGEWLLVALDAGTGWEIDLARTSLATAINNVKGRR